VSRKITRAAARIKHGIQEKLLLGNLNAKRDWGYAPEYVEGMWRILQQKEAEDFVLATGETHTVRKFSELVFKELDMELEWRGDGDQEKGIEKNTGKVRIEISKGYYRPTEVDLLIGDAAKAKEKLGWQPKVKFEELVKIMAVADWKKVQQRGF
jgi:GDPmannose 4,6-dehydratase